MYNKCSIVYFIYFTFYIHLDPSYYKSNHLKRIRMSVPNKIPIVFETFPSQPQN